MVERTTDMEAVARIFNHPKVYEWISDDTSVPPFIPDPAQLYLMNEEMTAVGRIDQMTGATCMVHIAALPDENAGPFMKEGIEWLFKNTPYLKIVGIIPEYNRAALALAKWCGFKEEGKLTKSFLKNWKLHDQVVLGLSKYDKEALCQQQQQ